MRKTLIIICLVLTPLILLNACRPAPTPAPSPVLPAPAPAPTPPAPPPNQAPENELSFHLSSDATPGDTDQYATYGLPLYLEAGQELTLSFKAVGAKVLLSVRTPTPETWGYSPSDAESTTGIIAKSNHISVTEGSATFTAPETGNYIITVKSASPKAEIDVSLSYRIESNLSVGIIS